ncbi:glycosyltransferase [Agromyces sp. NPDC004153]
MNRETRAGAMRWSLITVTHNSEDKLRRFWPAHSGREDVEWLVVDNASSDRTADAAEKLGARVIRLATNVGFSRANNIGFDASAGTYVAYVNPDVSVDLESLIHLEEELDKFDGLVGPQLMYEDGTPQPNGRGLPSLPNKIRNRLDARDSTYRVYSDPAQVKHVAWLMGAAVAAKRQTVEAIGGWDERYFIYYEDSELGLRAWQRGLEVRLVGSARWIHGWARETTSLKWGPWRRELQSMVRFYRQHPLLLVSSGGRSYRALHAMSGRLVRDGSRA